jgi:hypothetical protein
MIHMSLKWHHIDKRKKNSRKVHIFISILVHLSSSVGLFKIDYIKK